MYRIIRSTTAEAQRADLAAAQVDLATLRGELEALRAADKRATDAAIRAETTVETLRADLGQARADAARIEGEAAALRSQDLLDTEDRMALRRLLLITRKQARTADRVYVLFQHGALHSIHATLDSAESTAEAEGAPRSGWTQDKPGAPLPPASEVPWRIQGLPLDGTRSDTTPN